VGGQRQTEKGVSVYVGDGAIRWAAAPLKDVAHLYRLAVEKTGSNSRSSGTNRCDYCDAIYGCVAGFALKVPLKLSRY
jgi:hypothetical protein